MGHQFGCRGNTSYGATTDDEPAALMFTTKDTKDSEKQTLQKALRNAPAFADSPAACFALHR